MINFNSISSQENTSTYFLRESFQKKIFIFLSILFVFSLPFAVQANSLLIILLILNRLFESDFKKNFKTIIQNKFFLLFISFFLFHVLGLLYSQNFFNGKYDIEKKMALLAFPLILINNKNLISKHIDKLLLTFVLSWTAMTIVCFGYAFYRCSTVGFLYPVWFYREPFIEVVGWHPTYFAIYCILSIFILVYFISKPISKYPILKILSACLLITIFFIEIVLVGARMPLIAFFVITILFSFYQIIKKKKFILGILVFLSFPGITFIIYKNFPVTFQRYLEIKNTAFEAPRGEEINSTNLRIAQINCSVEIIKDNLLLGVGTGDVTDKLNDCYKTMGYSKELYLKNYNSHNQYFQTTLSLGIIGLLLLLSSLLYPLIKAIQQKNLLYIAFILLFMLCFLTEAVLLNQKGVVLFAFMNSLLAYKFLEKKPI